MMDRTALLEVEKGLGSLLWVMNNRHNWAHPEFDNLAESAEEDARRALDIIREERDQTGSAAS